MKERNFYKRALFAVPAALFVAGIFLAQIFPAIKILIIFYIGALPLLIVFLGLLYAQMSSPDLKKIKRIIALSPVYFCVFIFSIAIIILFAEENWLLRILIPITNLDINKSLNLILVLFLFNIVIGYAHIIVGVAVFRLCKRLGWIILDEAIAGA